MVGISPWRSWLFGGIILLKAISSHALYFTEHWRFNFAFSSSFPSKFTVRKIILTSEELVDDQSFGPCNPRNLLEVGELTRFPPTAPAVVYIHDYEEV